MIKIFALIFLTILLLNNSAYAAIVHNKIQADKVSYNKQKNLLTAHGNVQIYYNGNYAKCDNLYYNKNTQKILAIGNVTFIDNKKNIMYSDKIDLTKDLNNGLINNIKAKTTEDTYFQSISAKRLDNGNITIFNDATYTACKSCDFSTNNACKQNGKLNQILWQIHAKQIIWNSHKKTLSFKHSKFNVFDKTLLSLPNFTIPDYSVKRNSGFLAPSISYNNYLGYGVTAKYFFNLSPTHDLTLRTTHYSKQGFFGSLLWRHALSNGNYNINIAYIRQQNQNNFPVFTIDSRHKQRTMIATKGDFKINNFWSYGWNIFHQSDGDFARSYNFKGYNDYTICSSLYLKGLGYKNYFDLNFYNFKVQDAYKDINSTERNKYNKLQPWILPQLNYGYIAPHPIFGGELQMTNIFRTIYRNNDLEQPHSPSYIPIMTGSTTHLTSEISWKKSFVTKKGLVFTPLLALRGDLGTLYRTQTKINHGYAGKAYGLATAGLEAKYPILINTKKTTQIIEPTAQLFLRNNIDINEFLPNENAHEFNFNALSLFKTDKFSGTDRIEYGSRANIGIRYMATINNKLNIYAIGGQSIQLSRNNPFITSGNSVNDFCAGLTKKYSDYVSAIQFNVKDNFSLIFRNRFDANNYKLKNNEIDFSKNWQNFSLSAYYFSINKQAALNTQDATRQLANIAKFILNKNWQINLYQNLDLTHNQFMNIGSSLHYQNDCVGLDFNYTRDHPMDEKMASNNFGIHLSLRTLLDINNE